MDNDNMTLYLNPDTLDLEFDIEGNLKLIYDEDTIAQNVRNTLLCWKEEFFTDLMHGTDYESIIGKNQNEIQKDEIEEILREAVFQEPCIERINNMMVSYNGRRIEANIEATTEMNDKISSKVVV